MNIVRRIEMIDMSERIIEEYGVENQLNKLVEEMGELTVEVMKLRAGEHLNNDRVLNELADVLNVALQILIVWDTDPYDIKERMYAKLERQMERIEKHKEAEEEIKEIDLNAIAEADDFEPVN